MADTAEIEKKAEVVSMGKTQRVTFTPPNTEDTIDTKVTDASPSADEIEKKRLDDEAAALLAKANEGKTDVIIKPLSEMSDEEVLAEIAKRKIGNTEPTEEEKLLKQREFEDRMEAIYKEGGGKIEDYVALKSIVAMDLTELSKATIVNELKQKGYTEDVINEVLVERYYQINPEELEIGDDETEEAFQARKEKVKKKVELGKSQFEARGTNIKKQAETTLNNLKSVIESRDLKEKQEKETIAKIEDLSKTLPKSITLELGKLDDKPLGSVAIDVPETMIKEIVDDLKDPAKRKQLLFNEDDSLNIDAVAQLILRNKLLENTARESLFEGQTRQTKIFREIFPHNSPNSLGLGGNTSLSKNNGKGQVASAGKVQRINTNGRR